MTTPTPTTATAAEEEPTTAKAETATTTTKAQDDKHDSKQAAGRNTSKSQDDASKDGKKAIIDRTISIKEEQLGVWKLQIGVPKTKHYLQYVDEVKSSYPLLRRLATDIYLVAPRLFVFFVLCQMWQGVEDALMMQLSSSLLRTIESGLITGHPDTKQILVAIAARLLCSLFVAYLSWHGQDSLTALRSRVTCHFDMFLMKAKLNVDLPTSHEAGSQPEGSADDAWSALDEIIYFLTQLLTTVSHLALIAHLSKQTGGPVFAFLCVSRPVFSAVFSRSLWDRVSFGYIHNEHYRRMKALENFAGGSYRQDVISGNLSDWILKEYQKSYDSVGELHIDHPYEQYGRRELPFFDMVTKALGDSPMIYCALCAIIAPSKFSVASIAILQQSSTTLRYSLETIFRSSEQFRRSITNIKNIYASSTVINTLNDGQIPYPPPATEKDTATVHKGMSFDLKAVSFSYPGSQKSTPALDKVSLSIPAGHLIVIVGSNGSGKSTLVRILSRLYDPSSGQVHIDNRTSSEYRMHDLHQATTILSQDNLIYPLSFAENIGLGFPERCTDTEMIKEAAREGGAEEFIGKLKNGVDTTLIPMLGTFSCNLYGNKTHPLYEEMEKMDKTIDISGGERQRIVASRSFMRFKSGKVKFVAVDEPSSALDAEGELQLFDRLIAAREGKTMVFVTHRFGHLTKHADQIICMKDGAIAEVGTHDELLGKKGEYSKLYEIQASAFTPTST